jgi:hypothetical protein
MLAIPKIAKNRKIFCCEICDYYTHNKFDFKKHTDTVKHKSNEMSTKTCDLAIISMKKSQEIAKKSQEIAENTQEIVKNKEPRVYSCKNCNKIYKDNSGLWRHKKICSELNIDSDNDSDNDIDNDTNKSDNITEKELILMLIKENSEFKNMMFEMCKGGTSNITNTNAHNNNTTNSHNKTFNLQFFLNETCKDAMNIMDFVEQIVLNLNDLEETGRIGFAEGISKMITSRLKALDVTQRPIHCCDLKRETLYIKDENKWEKEEDSKPKLTKAVKKIAGKNMNQIFEWQKIHPEYSDPDTRTCDKYMKMLTNVMSGGTEEEIQQNYDKIVKNIIKETTIDKENYLV